MLKTQKYLQYTIETLGKYHDGKRKLRICEVSASMPSLCWGRYCHLRVYHAGDPEPYGNVMRNLNDGQDYYGFSGVHVPMRRTTRSLYGRIHEAVRIINERACND